MTHSTPITTADELLVMPDDGNRYELVEGELRMMSPAGGRHGRVALKLALQVGNFVSKRRLGEVFAAETGFLLKRDPDTVRAPDLAFVSTGRLGNLADETGFLPLAPDLVAEVLSPNDRTPEVEAKVRDWLTAGVRAVLVVDPEAKSVRHYRTDGDSQTFTSGTLDLDDVLPGFQLNIPEVFS